MKFEPNDLLVWLSRVDVNGLAQVEADRIKTVDINSDFGLEHLVRSWIRPWFDGQSFQNQLELKSILAQSRSWPPELVRSIFGEVLLPSGQRIESSDRFLAALSAEFLE